MNESIDNLTRVCHMVRGRLGSECCDVEFVPLEYIEERFVRGRGGGKKRKSGIA